MSLVSSVVLLLASLASLSNTETYVVDKLFIVRIEGVIGQGTASLVDEAVRRAEDAGGAVMLLISTPGGELGAVLSIMQRIVRSQVPVIGFVYPDYSYAWSGGTYILLSTHIAAMTPHSVIGSCQPVAGAQPINESKILNALIKFFETVVEDRGRNSTFAKLCIEKNLNLNGVEAEKYRVIDLVASDLSDLLRKVNGSIVEVGGRNITVVVYSGAELEYVEPRPLEWLQIALSDPMIASIIFFVALLLALAGLYGGEPISAIIGLSLMILVMATVLPTPWYGIIVAVVGAVLILLDMFGGLHGAGALVGSVLVAIALLSTVGELWNQPLRIDVTPIIYGMVGSAVALVGFGVVASVRIFQVLRRRPASEQLLQLVGTEGMSVDDIDEGGEGTVLVFGEYWRAKALRKIRKGCRVRVVGNEDGKLIVEPIEC